MPLILEGFGHFRAVPTCTTYHLITSSCVCEQSLLKYILWKFCSCYTGNASLAFHIVLFISWWACTSQHTPESIGYALVGRAATPSPSVRSPVPITTGWEAGIQQVKLFSNVLIGQNLHPLNGYLLLQLLKVQKLCPQSTATLLMGLIEKLSAAV